ncbi:bacteriophage T4 gp5 trimerisation domain-containing protein [Escherichia coli]|uniref:bacteriophage T4 gp5 trimerisation domain-containing protein n=1 Tax=Escherichia coli TaxID=562 RepID=UPI0010B2C0B0|nr:baseplate assembly protein [Escherichia coli]GCK83319.1 type VI secretion system Vgr family protein [Escherichia coli]
MSTGLRFTLEVDGLPPDAFAVVSFHLNQSLSSLFSLDLSLVSQQFLSLEFAQVLDKMTIRSKTYMGSGFNELKFDDATGREQVYIHAQKNMDTEVLNDRTTTVKHDHRETVKNDQTVTIQEGNRLLTVEKGHKITGVLKGSLSEDVFQDRGTIAGSVHVDAVNNGGEGDGIQAYTAIKEILLAVEESKIALTPDGIQLQVGESTVIRLSKDGITIVGGSVFIN